MRTATRIFPAILLASLLAGCPGYTKPVPRGRELTAAEKDFEAIWQASTGVLRKYRFTLATQDRRAGLIATYPMTSKYLTEFWRREATTARDSFEGSLHTIYRTAGVEIVPAGDKFRAYVQVDVSRSNRREPMVTSTSQAYELFSMTAREKLTVEYGEDTGEAPILVQLGRDRGLEEAIAAKISAACGMPASPKAEIPQPSTLPSLPR